MKNSIFISVALALLLAAGCGHEDFPGQTDEGHIENFINNEDKGLDLFRVTDIFPSTPYQWPNDPAIYYDSVLSVDRDFSTTISDSSWNYGILGWLFEGVSRVTDNFTVRTFKILNGDTTFTDGVRPLVRAGYFLKLGRDSDYNFGWDLWGMGYFNQSSLELAVGIWFADSTSMRGDFDLYSGSMESPKLRFGLYRPLTDFRAIADSSEARIDVSISQVGDPARFYTRVSYPSADGYTSVVLQLSDSEHASGTLVLRERVEPAYDCLVISIYDTQTREFARAWAVPYRINPVN